MEHFPIYLNRAFVLKKINIALNGYDHQAFLILFINFKKKNEMKYQNKFRIVCVVGEERD